MSHPQRLATDEQLTIKAYQERVESLRDSLRLVILERDVLRDLLKEARKTARRLEEAINS